MTRSLFYQLVDELLNYQAGMPLSILQDMVREGDWLLGRDFADQKVIIKFPRGEEPGGRYKERPGWPIMAALINDWGG